MRRIVFFTCAVALTGSMMAAGQTQTAAKPQSAAHAVSPKQAPPKVEAQKPLLPGAFAGWVADAAPKIVSDAAQLDVANAAALKEYGLTDGVTAVYKREGETLTVKALEFPDVSGAYGAYSFYRVEKWPKEEIGSGAASNGNRVIFWRGTVVIDATFSQVHPESDSELRELADGLPQAQGNKSVTPPVLDLLPKEEGAAQKAHYEKVPDGLKLVPGAEPLTRLEELSPRYAVGPVGYAGAGGVLPVRLIGFDVDAETVTASYSLSSGPAVLTLISYPTPQMASAAEQRIRAYIDSGKVAADKTQAGFTQALKDSDQASLEVRRTGPVVALVSGDAVPDESHRLIERVHYSSDLTSMPMPGVNDVAKTGSLLMNIAYFVVVVGGAAILLGLLIGGGRAWWRVAHGKPVSSVYEEEFTRLDLRQ